MNYLFVDGWLEFNNEACLISCDEAQRDDETASFKHYKRENKKVSFEG